jgi:electron transfer flavoprotein beta subunit
MRAKTKPIAASSPARPASRLERVRLVVPEGKGKEAEVLGRGADAAGAVVDLLEQIGVA